MLSISDYQKFVESEIGKLELPGYPHELYDPVAYMLHLGGKRIRPVLTLMANDLFGGNIANAISPALAMEVFHNFTLVHDDLMDKARLRRGQATIHEKWNPATAILSGDVMLVLAYDLLKNIDINLLPGALDLFNETARRVCEGQQLDMVYEQDKTISIDSYIEMIGLKTAALLAGCLSMGALLSKSSEADRKEIYDFGFMAGIAFQVQDDLLDAYGNSEDVGKNIGGDIVADKKTYLTVKAFELAEGEIKEELSGLFGNNEKDAEYKIKRVLAIYDTLKVKGFAEQARDTYYEKALNALKNISAPEDNKQMIRELGDLLIKRNH